MSYILIITAYIDGDIQTFEKLFTSLPVDVQKQMYEGEGDPNVRKAMLPIFINTLSRDEVECILSQASLAEKKKRNPDIIRCLS